VAQEVCELCGGPIESEHRHLLDVQTRQLLCSCRACSLLFDRTAAGGGHYRLIPQRRLRLERFVLSDELWERLRIPVDMAYFFHNSLAERVVAFYPSPMGATESHLELQAWEEIQQSNPSISTLEPDVEALLVNRMGDARRYWLVPIEDCYRLVAAIRTRWRGFTGGKDAWQAIDAFFEDLNRRASPDRTPVGEENTWRGSTSASVT
jgi:hypothetical protein